TVFPSRRVVTRPAERSTARCWLMFGTWQLTRLASSPTDASPPARDSRTHRRLGSPRARATAAERCRSASVVGWLSSTHQVSHWLRKNASIRQVANASAGLHIPRPGLDAPESHRFVEPDRAAEVLGVGAEARLLEPEVPERLHRPDGKGRAQPAPTPRPADREVLDVAPQVPEPFVLRGVDDVPRGTRDL